LAGALQVSATWLLTGEESADEVELALTRDIAQVLRNQDEFARGLASLERDVRDLYRLVERLAEQQVRFLGNPGFPPRPDSPRSAS